MDRNEKITSLQHKGTLVPLLGTLLLLIFLYFFYVHIQLKLLPQESKVLEAILLSAFSSLLVSGILDYILRKDFVKIVREEAYSSIFEIIDAQSNIQSNGLRNVYNGLPYEKFLPKLKVAKEAMILQTFIPDTPSLLDEIRKMVSEGGKIRILVLDPESKMAQVRAESLGRSNAYIREGILTCLEDLNALKKESPDGVEIKVYDTIPSISVYKADDMVFIGHYILGVHAVEGPQLELETGKYYADIIVEHFKKLWDKGKYYNIENKRPSVSANEES